MAKKPNTPEKSNKGKGKGNPDAKPTKKNKEARNAEQKRSRPSRLSYSNFVADLSSERQEKQLWGIFAWYSRLRGTK